MNLIVVMIILLKIFPGLTKKTTCIVKLESVTPTYVNHTLIDYDINAVPFNKTVNVHNQTLMIKFDVLTENILLFDTSSYRITKNNRTFLMSHGIVSFEEIVSMETLDVVAMWRDYTRPPLIWPPQINITYRTFGWAADVSKNPFAVPSGRIKIVSTLRFPNHTELYTNQWIFNVVYE